MSTKRTIAKWEAMIERLKTCPYIQENEIVYFRKFIAANWNGVGEHMLNLFNEHAAFNDVLVTPEQAEKGLNYMRTKLLKVKGGLKKGSGIEAWHETDLRYCLDNFSHFTLDELRCCPYNQHNRRYNTPVYTLHATDGSTFSYHVGGMGDLHDYTITRKLKSKQA